MLTTMLELVTCLVLNVSFFLLVNTSQRRNFECLTYVSWAYTVRFQSVFDPINEPHDSFQSQAKFWLCQELLAMQCMGGSKGRLTIPEQPLG